MRVWVEWKQNLLNMYMLGQDNLDENGCLRPRVSSSPEGPGSVCVGGTLVIWRVWL